MTKFIFYTPNVGLVIINEDYTIKILKASFNVTINFDKNEPDQYLSGDFFYDPNIYFKCLVEAKSDTVETCGSGIINEDIIKILETILILNSAV